MGYCSFNAMFSRQVFIIFFFFVLKIKSDLESRFSPIMTSYDSDSDLSLNKIFIRIRFSFDAINKNVAIINFERS